MAAQAGHFLVRIQRVGKVSYRMLCPRVSGPLSGVKRDLGNCLEILVRHGDALEEHHRFGRGPFGRVARETKRIAVGPRLGLELRGVRVMASEALTDLDGAMHNWVLRGLMTHPAKIAPGCG